MCTADRRTHSHGTLRTWFGPVVMLAVACGLAATTASWAGQPVSMLDEGSVSSATTRATHDSLAKARAAAAKPTSTKPGTTVKSATAPAKAATTPTQAVTAPASTRASAPGTATRPTPSTSAAGTRTTVAPTATTAKTTTTKPATPAVAGVAKAAAKPAAPTVARVAAGPSSARATATQPQSAKPGGSVATVGKVATGAAAATALTARPPRATPEPVAAGGSVKPIARTGPAGAATSSARAGAAVSKAAAPKSATPGRKAAQVATAVPLDDHVTYQYNALGRRDVFTSLMDGEFVGADVGGNAPPDVGGVKLVGIVWGTDDQFAMVEDARGDSYVLRRGDKVMNGFVEGLKRDAMIVNMTVDGQSQSVTIPVTRKGEKSNAIR